MATTTNRSEGISMSESQYDKLAEKIDQMSVSMATIVERLADYPECKVKIYDSIKRLDVIERTCAAVQSAKTAKGVQPGALKTGIIIGIIVGGAVSLINVVLALLL